MDKIRAIPILDVAEKLGVEVKKRGNKYWAKCLWHADNNPSMEIGGRYNNCHCYSCGASKGVLDLVLQHENLDVKGALELLAKEFGLSPQPSPPQGKGSHAEGWKVKRLEALVAKPLSPDLSPNPSPVGRGAHADGGDDARTVMRFNPDWVKARMTMDNSFVMCLKDVFGEDEAARVVRDYWLCSVGALYGINDVGFPLIDVKGVIRDVKVQGYQWDKRSDKYFHGNGTCYWLGPTSPSPSKGGEKDHADGEKDHADEKNERLFDRRCLFGEHLLNFHPDRTVVLVESPKNACVGSARYPELLWVAAGNKSMLSHDVLQVLSGRRVVVFPDNDAYEEWSDRLKGFSDITMFKVLKTPSNSPSLTPSPGLSPSPSPVGRVAVGEGSIWGEKDKSDIADWIIKQQSPL